MKKKTEKNTPPTPLFNWGEVHSFTLSPHFMKYREEENYNIKPNFTLQTELTAITMTKTSRQT